jgi:magnesium transporter
MSKINRTKEQIQFCIRGELWEKLLPLLDELHPADIADVIEDAPDEIQSRIFELLDDETKADVLSELDDSTEADILEELTAEEISELAEEMAPDDAADMLAELDDERSKEVLELMEDEDSEEVRGLLRYEEDTAGGLMTTDFVALRSSKTAQEALDHIGSLELDEPVYSAYITDAGDKLLGHVQLWQLIKAENRAKTLGELAESDLFSTHPDTDQEAVAQTMSKYDLSSLPVIDRSGKLVGRITIDDMIDVMEEEASEDIFKLAGSDDAELEDPSPFSSCKARLPWLLITLASGFVTSMILKGFMQRITAMEVLALSFFVPIVMGMGGNTGIQSSTLIIRGLALGSFNPKTLHRLLARELATGMLMGLICGSVIGIWARFVISGNTAFHPEFLALSVGIALCSAMMFAAIFGAAVPLILNRVRIDPAVASGPFVSASNDIFALLIYYGVTFLMISSLPA